MHSERLIPLNPETLSLIKNIQTKSRVVDPTADRLIPNIFKAGTLYAKLRNALSDISKDLYTPEPITPHRLRHSLASELLNGGMSLYGLMRILGHKSTVTTQIYADVALETIRTEYFQALDKVTTKYVLPQQRSTTSDTTDPKQALSDAIRWLQKNTCGSKSESQRKRALLVKRMHRLKSELDDLEKGDSIS